MVYRRIRIPTFDRFQNFIPLLSSTNSQPRYSNRYSKDEKKKWYVLRKKKMFRNFPGRKERVHDDLQPSRVKIYSLSLSLSINFVFLGNGKRRGEEKREEKRRGFHVLWPRSDFSTRRAGRGRKVHPRNDGPRG